LENIAIVTDSAASIPEALLAELKIHCVPYYIHHGNKAWRDLATIQRDEFYAWLPSVDELPTTASPGPGDYLDLYRKLGAESGVTDVISIHMTSKGSGAYQAACSAKAMIAEVLPKLRVKIIDTLNVSLCHGWMVIEAARAALRGASTSAILERIQRMIPATQMIQTADTLRYLYMGGRIGKATQLVGSLLNIKPLISMREGVIVAVGKTRSRARAYERMVEMVEQTVGRGARIKIAYVHAAAREEAEKIRELVETNFEVLEGFVAELSPALGVHSGPGTAGVCFFPASVLD
jgi:DegV family protein with EDD domain